MQLSDGKKTKKKIFFVSDLHPFNDNRVFKSIQPFLNSESIKSFESILEKTEYFFDIYYQYNGNQNRIFYENDITYVETEKTVYNNAFFFEFFKDVDYDVLYLHNVNINEFNLLFDALKKDSIIIFDCHEYIPSSGILLNDFFRFLGNDKKKFVDKSFKKFLDASHGVVVVSEMMKKLIMENFNVPESKILKFTNYAPMSLDKIKPFEERRKELTFVGLTPRNMSKEVEILDALSNVFKIKVIGIKESIKLFTSEKLNEKVQYLPFLPYLNLLEELSYSMFSIISFRNFADWHQGNLTLSLPNKFFDSMAAGVPVIVSENFVELCDVVKNDNVGIIIDPEKTKESIDKILEYSQKEKYEVLLENIIKHRNKYIYDNEKKTVLRDFVVKIIRKSEKEKEKLY